MDPVVRLLRLTQTVVLSVARMTRTLLQATLLLLVLLCVVEVGVRLFEGPVGEASTLDGEREYLAPSWTSGQRLKPLVRWKIRDGQGLIEVRTNSLGLRGTEPVVPKPGGVVRVVCLGDERVLAADVSREQTFCHRLQELLQEQTGRRVEVINAGVPGHCPLLSLLQVRHDLLSLDVDLWVLTFDMSDVADDYRVRPRLIVDGRGRPLACPHPSLQGGPANAWQQMCRRFRLVDWSSHRLGRLWTQTFLESPGRDPGSQQGQYAWLAKDPPDWTVHVQQALDPIRDLFRLCRKRLVVAACPAPWQVGTDETRQAEVRLRMGVPPDAVFPSDAPFRIVADFTERHGIPSCDMSMDFHAASKEKLLFQEKRPELNARGHALVARLLAARLTNGQTALLEYPDESTGQQPVRPVSIERRDRASRGGR